MKPRIYYNRNLGKWITDFCDKYGYDGWEKHETWQDALEHLADEYASGMMDKEDS